MQDWSKMRKTGYLFLAFALAVMPAAFAFDKKEAAEQIEQLNKKILEASGKNDLQGAIEAAEDALTVARLGFGEESPEAAKAMNNVANLYMFSRHPQEASELYKKALEIETKEKGRDSTDAADTHFNLAASYGLQAKFDDARASIKEALRIREKKLGKDHPDTVKAREMLEQI